MACGQAEMVPVSDRLSSLAAGFAWGVHALLGIEAVIAVKALQRSGGALKTWAAFRQAKRANPTAAAEGGRSVQ